MITKYKSRDNSKKVAQKKHLKSKNTSAGKHCCQGDIYARNSPPTNAKENGAGQESVAWRGWQSCWCKEGRRACAKAADCLLLSLQLHYLCALVATPKWKTATADAPTLPNVAYPSVLWIYLLQEKMMLMQRQPPLLLWQPTEKSSYQNDQEGSQRLRRYSFPFAWWFAATYQWLGCDTLSFDLSPSFCFQFAF